MLVATAAWRSTKTFSSRATIIGFTKFASKAAIPQAIPIVFRERALAVAGGLWARHFSRHQPRHGMAVRRGARSAGTEARSGAPRGAADGAGACAIHRDRHCRGDIGSR